MRTYSGGFGDVDDLPEDAADPGVLLPPIELAQLAASLREAGITVALRDLQLDRPPFEATLDFVRAEAPDVLICDISLGALESDAAYIRGLVAQVPRVYLRTSVQHDAVLVDMLQRTGAHAIMHPACVQNIAEIVGHDADCNTTRLDGAGLHRGPVDPTTDLDQLPLPARDLLENRRYNFPCPGFEGLVVTTVHTSYGCPYPCDYYCPYPLAEGKRVRTKSVARVVHEIQSAVDLGIGAIVFRDPVFTINRRRTLELTAEIAIRWPELKWTCETRIDRLDEELLEAMATSGCTRVEVGVESLSDGVAARAKQGLTAYQVMRCQQWAKQHGIALYMLLLFGLPWDTRYAIATTLRYILDTSIPNDAYTVSIITPYPGTQLYEDALANNWVRAPWSSFGSFDVVMQTDRLSTGDLRKAKSLANDVDRVVRMGEGDHSVQARARLISEIDRWACEGVSA